KREGTTEVERAVRGLYSIMEDARESLETVTTSISLAQELVKIRERGFSEGVATASEVVEANALLAKSNLAAMLSCYQYEIALSNMIALCGESLHFSSFLNREGNIYR
ncbi:MAG: TolC family protein, partial [Bacteroidales bacterium]|nr:TolC family protein [Bacteroidales bacterium]